MHGFAASPSTVPRRLEWTRRVDTVGFKLVEGKGLREGWDSKEL